MANRSYLYSTNTVPGLDVETEESKLICISECNYGIPVVYKLLLSGKPKVCKSSIWDMQEDIAIAGDYAQGVERLKGFLEKIKIPAAQPLIQEAFGFLWDEKNRKNYFVLECNEIFVMTDKTPQEQNAELLEEIENLNDVFELVCFTIFRYYYFIAEMLQRIKRLLGKLLGVKPNPLRRRIDRLESIYSLGLGKWSNVLYYNFSSTEKDITEEDI